MLECHDHNELDENTLAGITESIAVKAHDLIIDELTKFDKNLDMSLKQFIILDNSIRVFLLKFNLDILSKEMKKGTIDFNRDKLITSIADQLRKMPKNHE